MPTHYIITKFMTWFLEKQTSRLQQKALGSILPILAPYLVRKKGAEIVRRPINSVEGVQQVLR